MAKYNHAYDIAFEVHTDNEAKDVTTQELLVGLRLRLEDLEKGGNEIKEACGASVRYL